MNKQMLRTTITQLRQIALFAVGVSLLTACGNSQGGMKLGDSEYAVLTVNSSSSDQTTSYPATIRGTQDIEIRPQVSGFIVKLCVDEGATVRKNQPLFEIDPTQYKAAYNQAKAAVEMAQANVSTLELTEKNKKELYDKAIISSFEYQTAVNQLASARATLAQSKASMVSAKQNLDFCTVKSPSNGVVGTFPYRIGSLVSPSISSPMTTVSEIGEVYVYFSMTEKELLQLTKAGGTLKEQLDKMPAVQLQLADGTMLEEKGKIDAVSGVIDQSTGSVSMRAVFPNDKKILRSGGTGNVIFPYTMDGIIMIPQSATVEIQDKKFVYVLQSDNTIKNTEIQISPLSDGQTYLVTKGLKGGDKIVIEGVQSLHDGQEITPITKAEQDAKFQQAMKDQNEGNLKTAFN
ncbi:MULTISPECIES: efflux RND transporter periplasmic adaptor subunit [Parabacteroides]|uniref:efflux RND transporter periplasmic adaptor subunit n=1 Tax=Parabacteroides TaxID=375288 RepID=UPI000F000459|nr:MULTISPECIES: efflux RND transporter periplasmic adaptor subunit [Parabacteroides]RHU23014.1 efflux RND transporter periplasmic adaptor subunit [Parabacteroides sp. TM07-1AC]WFE84906.1 efflux RND transporter periplasmic adaptor subunit [Parabacteroides chongii]